jgi:tetratricopeptide (TPR) repeat protein
MSSWRVLWLLCVGAALCIAVHADAAAREPLRTAGDIRELARLTITHPEAVTLIQEGDATLAQGKAAEAVSIYQKASQIASDSSIAWRRQCEAQTWAGNPTSALTACQMAMKTTRGGTATILRAMVAAMMWNRVPSAEEYANALLYSRLATQQSPDQPWGYAAACDIAFRVGDTSMFTKCKESLSKFASTHYESQRVASWGQARTPWGVILAWTALAGLLLVTFAHALKQRFSAATRGRMRLRRVSGAVLLAALLASPHTFAEDSAALPAQDDATAQQKSAPAGGLSKWPINRQDPVSSVPSPKDRDANPIEYGYFIMDLADLAGNAARKGDYAAAAKYWEASTKAVPDAAGGFRRACDSNEKAGKPARALVFCTVALSLPGVLVEDYLHYGQLAFAQSPVLSKPQLDELNAVVEHLKKDPKGQLAAAEIECELATRQSDRKRLEACTGVLGNLAPKDARTISFQWALAMMKGEFDRAQVLVAEAKAASMPPAGIEAMETGMRAERTWPRRLQRSWAELALVGGLGFLIAIALLRTSRRKRTLSAAKGLGARLA